MRPGAPSLSVLGRGFEARCVEGAGRPQGIARDFWDRIAALGGERQLIRGDYAEHVPGAKARIGGKDYAVAVEYVDMGPEEGKRYSFLLMDPDADPRGDWLDAVAYGVTLGRGTSMGESGDYVLRVHAPEGRTAEMAAVLDAFQSWMGVGE